MTRIEVISATILILCSLTLGFVVSEAAYRYILYTQNEDRFRKPELDHLGVYDKSHWSYSEKFGYGYPPKRKIHYTGINRDGVVKNCAMIDVINERGNIGPIEGNYDKADLKVLVFGDSWAAFNINGMTWTDYFQREMQARLGKSVHVVNFGRDGYGILQMFDLAANEISKWQPDLVIFAFITNDLARLRTWRVPIEVNGKEERVVTHFEPSKKPKPDKSYDTFLIHSDATPEWCSTAKERGTRGKVVDAIFKKYQRNVSATGDRWADIYTFTRSYLMNRLFYGAPFHGMKDRYDFPGMKIDKYSSDPQFLRSLEVVKKSGVPALLFHHAFYPEVIAEQEFIVTYLEQSLLDSLLALTDYPLVTTLDNVNLPVDRPERMNASETNYHPSTWGMRFYSGALTRSLIDKRLLFDLVPGLEH